MGHAAGFHHRAHIGKVQVDHRRHGDQIGNALNTLTQHVVRLAEGFQHRGALANHLQQAIIGDHYQRIHALLQLVDAKLCVLHALLALKEEGLGHNGNGKAAQLAGDFCHHRGRARAGAAAHTGGNKHQIGALERAGDFLAAFLSGTAADIGHSARTQTLGQLLADLNLGTGLAQTQRLTIGINGDEIHAAQPGVHHAVDSIVAAAAAADYFNRSKALILLIHLEFQHNVPSGN